MERCSLLFADRKRLPKSRTEVAIRFKEAPHMVFRGENLQPNSLILNIQPEEGISLSIRRQSSRRADAHQSGDDGLPVQRRPLGRGFPRRIRNADQ